MRIFMTRKILTVVLCWCLATLQIITFNRAFAESGSGSSTRDSDRCAGAGSGGCDQFAEDLKNAQNDNGSGLTEDQMNERKKRMEQDEQSGTLVDLGSGDGSGAGGGVSSAYHTVEFATLLIAMASGYAGTFFCIGCVNQPSAWIFGLVSIAYIIAEIVQTATTKDAASRRLTIITNVSKESVTAQTEALNQAIEQTKTAADHANTRYIVTSVMAALYIVAAIVALVEGILNKYPGSWNDQCSGASAWWWPVPGSKEQKLSLIESIMRDIQNMKKAAPIWSENTMKMLLPALGIQDAQADDTLLAIGIVGALSGIFLPVFEAVKAALSAGKSSGFVRAAVMAVVGGFVIAAAVIIKEKKDQLDERVKKYNELLSKLKERLKAPVVVTSETKVDSLGKDGFKAPESTSIETEKVDPLKGNCATGDQKKPMVVADLGCKKTPMVIEGNTDVPNNDVVELPASVLNAAKNSKTFATNMAQGKGIGELRQYDRGSYAKFNKIKSDLGKKFQDFSKKYADEPVSSIEETELGIRKKLSASMKAEIQKYPVAQINSMMGQVMGLDAPEVKGITDVIDSKNVKKPVTATGDFKNMVPKIKLEDEAKENAGGENAEEVSSVDALKGLKYKEQDISNDTGASLFLIITNRYRKTAYPVFFDKNEPVKGNGP